MITEAQLDALEAAARSWVGTPFCEGSPVKGAGVCCQHLCAEIYIEAGLMPRMPIPNGPTNFRAASHSLIERWVDESGLFVQVGEKLEHAAAGDLLGVRLGVLHHLAILLRRGKFVHVFTGHKVAIVPQMSAPWAARVQRVWRLRSLA